MDSGEEVHCCFFIASRMVQCCLSLQKKCSIKYRALQGSRSTSKGEHTLIKNLLLHERKVGVVNAALDRREKTPFISIYANNTLSCQKLHARIP